MEKTKKLTSRSEYHLICIRIGFAWAFFILALLWRNTTPWLHFSFVISQIEILPFAFALIQIGLEIGWLFSLIFLYRSVIIKNYEIQFKRIKLVTIMLTLMIVFGFILFIYTITEAGLSVVANYTELIPPTVNVILANTPFAYVMAIFYWGVFSFFVVSTYYIHNTAKKANFWLAVNRYHAKIQKKYRKAKKIVIRGQY